MRILLTCLAVMMILPVATLAQDGGRLTVTGEGQATATPDMATLTLGVTERARNARDAMNAVSDSVGAIIARLRQAGIEPRDMQTSDLSLGPVWSQRNSNGENRISGYEASNRLTVRVRALDDLGGILDAVLEDGANRFSGLRFGMQEPLPLLDAARRDAVADARRKAELYAEAAGVSLGAVLSISEAGGARPVMADAMFAARAEAMPVAAGEATMAASVTVVFAIGE